DPGLIELRFEGVRYVRLDAEGNLIVAPSGQELKFLKPRLYQRDVTKKEVAGRFVLTDDARQPRVRFEVGPYDHRAPLVIDPQVALVYSTYLGGRGPDVGNGIAVDSSGHAIVTGTTNGTGFPSTTIDTPQPGGHSLAFITKFSADGRSILYSTFLGGFQTEVEGGQTEGNAIVVGPAGRPYITRWTNADDFPTTLHAFQTHEDTLEGNAFLAELSSDGDSLVYSTILGGNAGPSGPDIGRGIAVDSQGHAFVTGETGHSNFPVTPNAFLSGDMPDSGDVHGKTGFVTKLAADGRSLIYSTFLGGFNGPGFGSAIAVDTSGHAYVTGTTETPNFPLKHPFEKVPSNDVSFCGPTTYANAFVTKLSADGGSLVYSTYLGGTCEDHGTGIAVDGQGHAYVSGWTASSSFPTSPFAFQNLLDVTEPSAFVTKFSASGETLLYSTHLGGHNGHTKATGIAEFGGNAFVTGWTEADDFPTKHAF